MLVADFLSSLLVVHGVDLTELVWESCIGWAQDADEDEAPPRISTPPRAASARSLVMT